MAEERVIPPRFAPAAWQYLYDADLPDHLYRTYSQIVGLASREGEAATVAGATVAAATVAGARARTPPLTLAEIAQLCGLSPRSARRHLEQLVERGLLVCETAGVTTRWLVLVPTKAGAPGAAAPGVEARGAREAQGTQEAEGAREGAASQEETLRALAEFGVDVGGRRARQVAALPHVTPELVRAWGEALRRRQGVRNLPGMLLHVVQGCMARPAGSATGDAAAARAVPDVPAGAGRGMGPAAAGGPGHGGAGVPDDLRRALEALGWQGESAWEEIGALVAGAPPAGGAPAGGEGTGPAHGLDFVWAWVRYVQEHPALGAGFLRSGLRSGQWPLRRQRLTRQQERAGWEEEEARRRAKRRAWYQAEAGADGPPRRPAAADNAPAEAGVPAEASVPAEAGVPAGAGAAMARYGIEAEVMATWKRTLDDLALQMTRATFDTWLRSSLLLSVEEGRARLGVRHPNAVGWVQNRLGKMIVRTLSRRLGEEVVVLEVVVLGEGVG